MDRLRQEKGYTSARGINEDGTKVVVIDGRYGNPMILGLFGLIQNHLFSGEHFSMMPKEETKGSGIGS